MDVGLARVSTRDQHPGLQITALEQAGCDHIYEEQVSGVSDKRPVRDQVLDQLQPGDTLTVWKLDRLGRSVVELLKIIRALTDRGVRFRCLTQPIDTSTPAGRMFLGILALVAEFERELMIERVLAGKQRQRAEGRPMGRLPFGWADADTIDPSQAALLCEASAKVLGGQPLAKIVDAWTAAGHTTANGSRWYVSPLRRVLLNPRTAAIVGDDDHAKLQAILNAPGRQRLGRPGAYLLSGILRCERCGSPMYGTGNLNYRCKLATGSGGRFNGCGGVAIALERTDRVVADMFVAAVRDGRLTDAWRRRQAELLAEDATAEQLDDWRAEIHDLETVPARFAPADATERLATLRRLVRDATRRLMAQPELAAFADLPKTETALRAAWDAWSLTERRTWLRRIFNHITVAPATAQNRADDGVARLAPSWRL